MIDTLSCYALMTSTDGEMRTHSPEIDVFWQQSLQTHIFTQRICLFFLYRVHFFFSLLWSSFLSYCFTNFYFSYSEKSCSTFRLSLFSDSVDFLSLSFLLDVFGRTFILTPISAQFNLHSYLLLTVHAFLSFNKSLPPIFRSFPSSRILFAQLLKKREKREKKNPFLSRSSSLPLLLQPTMKKTTTKPHNSYYVPRCLASIN